jgi:ATP synthase protein I
MTTAPQATSPGHRPGAAGPVVRRALLATAVLGLLLVLVAALLSGAPAALGAAIGTTMVVVFFAAGAVVLDTVATLAPAASLLVALLTYTLNVVLVAVFFVVMNRSGLLERDVDARWLAGGVIAATLVWLTAQVVATMRARIPVYELGSSNRPDTGRSAAPEAPEANER